MIEWFNEEIKKYGDIRKKEISPYDKIKSKGVKYNIDAYEINNLGTYSTLNIKAMCGLFKVVSIIFTPLTKDMPILSYDLIKVFGKTTLLIDLYNTNLEESSYPSLLKLKENTKMPKLELAPRWYDSIKGKESIAFKGNLGKEAISLSKEYILEFLNLLTKAKEAKEELKREKVKEYVDGLFSKGGPSVDQFKKMIGEKSAYDLFTHYIFGAIK